MHITIIQHADVSGPGLLIDYFNAHGWSWDCVTPDQLPSPNEIRSDVVVTLGAAAHVYENEFDWVQKERKLVKSLLEARVPVFGICFGAQVIAVESGGDVKATGSRFERWESFSAKDKIWSGPWVRFHGDSITPSPEAEIIAKSEDGIVQAFAIGNAVGVQFHAEASADVLRAWATHPFFDTPERQSAAQVLIEQAESRSTEIRENAYALYDIVFARLLEKA